MTMPDGTFCTILQGFPMLLILAQNNYRCLNTPLMYKPPTPTQSPEYLEALNTLYQHLFNENENNHGDDHYYGSGGSYDQGFYGTGSYGHGTPGVSYGPEIFGNNYPTFGNKYPNTGYGNGNKYPTFGNKYPTSGNKYPTFNYKPYNGHAAPGYPFVYKKLYNFTGVGSKGYAPNQIYNVKHKYKVVVKKSKKPRQKSQKLQGYFSRREQRQQGPYGFSNILNPGKIRERLTGILHLRPEDRNSDRGYIFPFRRPGITNEQERPYNQGQNQYNAQYQNGYYQQPVAFTTRYPINPNNGQYPPLNFNGNMYQPYSQNNNLYEPNNQYPPYNDYQPNNDYQTNNQYQPNNDYPSNNQYQPNNAQFNQEGNDNPIKNPNEEVSYDNVNFEEPVPNKSTTESTIPPLPVLVVDTADNHENDGPPAFNNNQGNHGIPQFNQEGNDNPIKNPKEEVSYDNVNFEEFVPNTSTTESTIPPLPVLVVDTADNHENDGPPAFNNNQGNHGIPNTPIENPSMQNLPPLKPVTPGHYNDANDTPPAFPVTELPRLTPVPDSEKKDNYNFGPSGIFQETCTTVDSKVGSCISLLSCDAYLKILNQSKSNPDVVNLLRRAHCGFEGNNPKVCCPRPGIPSVPIPDSTTTTTTTPAPQTVAPEPSPQSRTDDFVDQLPAPPECGVSNASFSRVIGGVDAKLGDFPWMTLLGYKQRRGPGAKWLCGGSLVTSRHVLTAAHCIHGHEDDLFLVRLGELDLVREDDGATPTDVLIKKKIKHEEYSSSAYSNDIGVLVLERHVTFTDLIRPICLPTDSELRARTFENYNPIITGWGATEFRGPSASHLQALQLPVVSNEFCAQAYSAYKAQRFDGSVICAGYKAGGRDACQGDSGGPLMQPIWNPEAVTTSFYQIGVVSFGRKCAEAGFPGVYARVTYYVPWLQSKLLGTE